MTLPPFLRARRARVRGAMTAEITEFCGFGWLDDGDQPEILDWLCLGWMRCGFVRGSTSDAAARKVMRMTRDPATGRFRRVGR